MCETGAICDIGRLRRVGNGCARGRRLLFSRSRNQARNRSPGAGVGAP